jgi:hypothetical protein
MTSREAFTAGWEAGRAIGVAQERARELRRKLEEGEADPLEVGGGGSERVRKRDRRRARAQGRRDLRG